MAKTAKKRNRSAQETTLINLRALKKRVAVLEQTAEHYRDKSGLLRDLSSRCDRIEAVLAMTQDRT